MSYDAQKIMTVERVAEVFGKGIGWVKEQAFNDRLVPHYAGDTMLFYEDEVVEAWKSGKLDNRRGKHVNSSKEKKNGRRLSSRSEGYGPSVLENVRYSGGS